MRDPSRIPRILALIQSIWALESESRLGQFMLCRMKPDEDLFNLEDDELEKRLKAYKKERLETLAKATEQKAAKKR